MIKEPAPATSSLKIQDADSLCSNWEQHAHPRATANQPGQPSTNRKTPQAQEDKTENVSIRNTFLGQSPWPGRRHRMHDPDSPDGDLRADASSKNPPRRYVLQPNGGGSRREEGKPGLPQKEPRRTCHSAHVGFAEVLQQARATSQRRQREIRLRDKLTHRAIRADRLIS